jgi:hypothetical protein
MNSAFISDRYGEAGIGDYINCPMTKDEYDLFVSELLNAQRAELHEFENDKVFDGCMPIEVMASRGNNTLRFGPMKPTGLTDPKTGRWPYACVQLRKENIAGDSYNIVGFQTNLLFNEQKRVFSLIPALKNAEYFRYGVMHKNTYIKSPGILSNDFSLIKQNNIYFAGQITGVEGYVESAASGLVVAINIVRRLKNLDAINFTNKTVIGALSNYVATENENFQPMNANFGVLEPLDKHIRDKAKRKEALEKLCNIKTFYNDNNEVGIKTEHTSIKVSLPMDDDFISLMKYIKEDKYVKQWLSRNYNLVALWKSKADFYQIFNSLRGAVLKKKSWIFHPDCRTFIAKKFTISEDDIWITRATPKYKGNYAKKVELYVNEEIIGYQELFPTDVHSYEPPQNEFYYVYVPRSVNKDDILKALKEEVLKYFMERN